MSSESVTTISVLLPTYKRSEMLRMCLGALLKQTRQPIEICVGRRENDAESAAVLAEFAQRSEGLVREAVVGPEGNLVASMNAALALTTGDLVALTDDDAEAPPDWLEKLVQAFADPTVGGVGGKDIQPNKTGAARTVGKLQWFGRVVGNHHLAVGPPRDVDLLKGVNCCFRGPLLREIGFDRRLRGKGNVSHWEMALCFEVLRRGFRMVFDPAITLQHHVAERHDGDVNCRGGFERQSFVDAVHNGHLSLLEHLPAGRRLVYRAWQFWIGTRSKPGIAQLLRLMVRGDSKNLALDRFRATRQGVGTACHNYGRAKVLKSKSVTRRWLTG